MRIIILFLVTISLSSCSGFKIVHFMNNFVLLAETSNTVPTLSARLLKVREFGECENQKCPQEVVYIAVSEFGEYPEQNVYITPKADEWNFLGWEHIPNLNEKNPTIIFKIQYRQKNVEIIQTIKVNLNEIQYQNLKDITMKSSGR